MVDAKSIPSTPLIHHGAGCCALDRGENTRKATDAGFGIRRLDSNHTRAMNLLKIPQIGAMLAILEYSMN